MTFPAQRVFEDGDALVAALAEALCAEADAAIAARGVFHLVLAGGTTPLALYRHLAARDVGDARWQLWYGDERFLPLDHPERNSAMIEAAWLSASQIPLQNRRPVPFVENVERAAAVYGAWLAAVPAFDVVLLGMGEDGHTASLFPGRDWGVAAGSPDVLPVHDAPKPPPQRVSLSAACLGRGACVWLLVTGAGKRAALQAWKAGEALPVSAVTGSRQTLLWLDRAAWPGDA